LSQRICKRKKTVGVSADAFHMMKYKNGPDQGGSGPVIT